MPKEEFYPAPPIDGAIPPKEDILRELRDAEPERSDIPFSLGNVLYRAERFEEAAEMFATALKLGGDPAKVGSNRSLALYRIGQKQEALRLLKEVTLAHPQLIGAIYNLGILARAEGNEKLARESFERVLKLDATHGHSLALLGELVANTPRNDAPDSDREAEALLTRAMNILGETPELLRTMALIYFRRGIKAFDEGNIEDALYTWSIAAKRFPSSFLVDQEILAGIRTRRETFRSSGALRVAKRALERKLRDNESRDVELNRYITLGYFEIGIFPELYVPPALLHERLASWRDTLAKEGEHAYPHYRIALLQSLIGELQPAVDQLMYCQDKLPKKKQESIRLAQVTEFLKETIEFVEERSGKTLSGESLEQWEKLGFHGRFQLTRWRRTGLSAEMAAIWRDSGISAKEAAEWTRLGVDAPAALIWREIGVRRAREAKPWIRAGLPPQAAEKWLGKSALSVEDMLQWIKAGFETAEEATAWTAIFKVPWEAARWKDAQFTPEEARFWREHEVYEPNDAVRRAPSETDT